MADQLTAAGANLTLTSRNVERLPSTGPNVTAVAADLRRPAAAEQVVEAALAAHGRVDGLVFAAGRMAFGGATDLPDDVLISLFTVNILAPLRLLRAARPHLESSAGQGRHPFVVHISAIVAETPVPALAAYSASKAALTAFDAAAARELRRAGIRLVDARPPHTETGLTNRPLYGTAPRLPRGLDPHDVAARIVRAIAEDETDLPSSAFG